jgi:hypothetical protein
MIDFMSNCIYVGIGLSGLAAISFMSMLVVIGCVRCILFNIWLVKFDKFLEDKGIKHLIEDQQKRLLIRNAVDSTYQRELDAFKSRKTIGRKVEPIVLSHEEDDDDGPVILKLHG